VRTAPATPPPDPPGGTLPPERRTSFVGREHELQELARALPADRIVTIIGPGGCGKTSLAIEASRHAGAEFPDGIHLVELAPLSDGALVPGAIAATLGIPDKPNRPVLETVADWLRGRRMLLVLDNCEHVADAAAETCDELLRRGPEVHVLATSREALGIEGERKLLVPPLGLPSESANARTVADSEAGRLFLDRARAVAPQLHLDDDNAAAVASICRRLDGLPLAIELAAARTGFLTPREIDERLDDRFRLLRSEARAVIPRHRTLRALIEWSYNLLDEGEAVLYRRLAVFVGGFTLDAAEEVCSGPSLALDEVLDLLGQLVEKSLVTAGELGGRSRYGMLETVRGHALEELRDSGEARELRARHLAWCSSFVERTGVELSGPRRAEYALAAEREFANVRVAFSWCLESGDLEAAMRLIPHRRYWQAVQEHQAEIRGWAETTFSLTHDADPTLRAAVLATAGELYRTAGDLDRARADLQDALRMQREHGDPTAVGDTLFKLGPAESAAGMDELANEHTTESVAIARATGNLLVLGEALAQHGEITYNMGYSNEARQLLEEGLELARAAGDAHTIAECLRVLGLIERDGGSLGRAANHLAEALSLQEELADLMCVTLSLSALGDLALRQGDGAQAEEYFAEALSFRQRIDYPHGMLDALWGLGAVAAEHGRLQRAARLVGAEEELRREAKVPLRLVGRERRDQVLASLRQRMGEHALAAAKLEGEAMHPDAVFEFALVDSASGTEAHWLAESPFGGRAVPTRPAHRAAEPRTARSVPAVFQREGEYFVVEFGGTALRLRDSKGLRYLARLLSAPGREFHCLDLVAGEARAASAPTAPGADLEGLSRSGPGDAGPILDSVAKSAYRNRLLELESDIEEAEGFGDTERAHRASSEREFILAELAGAMGLGGRDRRAASAAERARVNVTRALSAAQARVAEHSPDLARHLDATVHRGMYCSYRPDPTSQVVWRI
jgi:predicted ATPase